MVLTCASCKTQNRVPAARITARSHCGSCKAPLSPPAHPVGLASEADFDELVRDASLPVLVDFWAAWCGPCRAVAPELEKLATLRAGAVLVAKVDTEALPQVASRFRIQGIPTMVLFRGGREAKRVSGAMPAEALARALAL